MSDGDEHLMYLEPKPAGDAPRVARIGLVLLSKSGRNVYYDGLAYETQGHDGVEGEYWEAASGQVYWIASPSPAGNDQHWPGELTLEVDEDAQQAYEREVRGGGAA